MTRWADIEGTYVDLDFVHAVRFNTVNSHGVSTATLMTTGGEIAVDLQFTADECAELNSRAPRPSIDPAPERMKRPRCLWARPRARAALEADRAMYDEWFETYRLASGKWEAAIYAARREITQRKFDALIARVTPAIAGGES